MEKISNQRVRKFVKSLRNGLETNRGKIINAICEDYGITPAEAEINEFIPILSDVMYIEENFNKWIDQWIDMPIDELGQGKFATVLNRPYGITLLLTSSKSELASTIKPLVGTLAAGNCALLLPKSKQDGTISEVNKVLSDVLTESLDPERFCVLDEGQSLDELLESEQFDLVFSSCQRAESQEISSLCNEHNVAFKHHSPGWNVGIVENDAEIEKAAEKLIQNKFYKSGQDAACLDVIYIQESIYDEFLVALKNSIFYYYGGKKGEEEMSYGKIYDKANFEHIFELIDKHDHSGTLETTIFHNQKHLQINPIILKNPDLGSSLMNEKILGPILPLRTFDRIEDAVKEINNHKDIQKTFFFGRNPMLHNYVRDSIKFQEIFINTTNSPLKNSYMPQYGTYNTLNCMLNGMHSFHAFSKQKLYFKGLDSKMNIRKGNFFFKKVLLILELKEII